jgi:endo-1,4-beta-xylanase
VQLNAAPSTPRRPRDGFRRVESLGAIAAIALVATACLPAATADASAASPPPDTAASVLHLRDQAAKAGVLIGSGSINPNYLSDPQFASTLATQFNSLSPENELKWSNIEPQQGVFNFGPVDTDVAFAKRHQMSVKGHTLLTPGGFIPEWLASITDRTQLLAAMTNHIDTIMHRYAGVMNRWDVVTEPFLPGAPGTGSGLNTNNVFYQVLGQDYIADAFRIAHAANPFAKLFINESLVEYYPDKATLLYNLVKGLVDAKVPINGVALESHATCYGPPAGAITNVVNSYRALGLQVSLSEMDAHVLPDPVCPGVTDANAQQGQIYAQYVSEALAAGVKDISFWGFTDAKQWYTWLPDFGCTQAPAPRCAHPTMFDENYKPVASLFCHLDSAGQPRIRLGPELAAVDPR